MSSVVLIVRLSWAELIQKTSKKMCKKAGFLNKFNIFWHEIRFYEIFEMVELINYWLVQLIDSPM